MRMAHNPAAHVHQILHHRTQTAARGLLHFHDPWAEQALAHDPQHIVHQHTQLKEQFIDTKLAGGQTLKIEFALDSRKILLASPAIPIQPQHIGATYFLKICPDAENRIFCCHDASRVDGDIKDTPIIIFLQF
jgi:hypothetical protein